MTQQEREWWLVYAIIVAGKSATHAERSMSLLFLPGDRPFHKLRQWETEGTLLERLRAAKTGNYTKMQRALSQLVHVKLRLRTCSANALERVHGIGFKTSRFFLLQTRPDARCAALDVHILKWLRKRGYEAPIQSPQSKKRYALLEQAFLHEADRLGKLPAKLDAEVWSSYRRG